MTWILIAAAVVALSSSPASASTTPPGPPGSDVTASRPGSALRKLTPEEAASAIRRSLGALATNATVDVVEVSENAAPSGEIEFPLSGAGQTFPGRPQQPILWRGKVTAQSGQEILCWARVRVLVERRVVRARKAFTAGEILTGASLETVNETVSPLVFPIDLQVEQFIGTAAIRAFPAGTLLTGRLVQAAPVVRRGERVTVEALAGHTRLVFEAEARCDAREGQKIALTNLESKKTFWAMVQNGKVQVQIRQP